VRAAASSIASGRPPSRVQIWATAGPVVLVERESLAHSDRPLPEHLDCAVSRQVARGQRGIRRQRQRWHDILMLAPHVQRLPAGSQDFQARAGTEQFNDKRRGGEDVLEVVEHEEQRLSAQHHPHGVQDAFVAPIAQTERLCDRGRHELRWRVGANETK